MHASELQLDKDQTVLKTIDQYSHMPPGAFVQLINASQQKEKMEDFFRQMNIAKIRAARNR